MNSQAISFQIFLFLLSLFERKYILALPMNTDSSNSVSVTVSPTQNINIPTSTENIDAGNEASSRKIAQRTEAILRSLELGQNNNISSTTTTTTTTQKSIQAANKENITDSLQNVDRNIHRSIQDISAAFNSTDRTVRQAVQRSLIQTSAAFANNSATAFSNTVEFLSQLKSNLIQDMSNFSTEILKELERSAVRTQEFIEGNQNSLQESVRRVKNGSTEALASFTHDVANLTRVIQDGLMDLQRSASQNQNQKTVSNQSQILSNGTVQKSVGDIFNIFRNRQTNFQNDLSSIQTRVNMNFQDTFAYLRAGWQDVLSRSQLQFQIFMNGLLNLFNIGVNTLTIPFQQQRNSNSTNNMPLRLLPLPS